MSERTSQPKRVVIVDDEPDLRMLLRMQLSRQDDFDVVGEATDGSEGVAMVRDTGADLVVMDLLMPRSSGFEGIVNLNAEQPSVGVVAYTAVAGEYVREEMDRLGVELVLKSGDIDPLVDALRRTSESGSPV